LAYNFHDDTVSPPAAHPIQGSAGAAAPARSDEASTSAGAATSEAPQSAGFARFNSCRWQQPKEEGTAAFCTHREVKPYAGTTAFDADAWCPECQYYKLRRAPKKRNPNDDYSY
jgi:hypothetical protein